MLKNLVKFQIRANHLRGERGATAVEYGLMVGLLSIAGVVGLGLITRMLIIKYTQMAHDPLMGW